MQIAAPIFLLALIPWGGLVLWLLLGRRRRVNVSFLDLWKGPVSGPTARRRIGMPPLALVAALAAMLLMIAAAARPGLRRYSQRDQTPVIVVVDCGITMSKGKPPRFAVLLEELKPVIREQFGREARAVFVPSGDVMVPTAVDTSAMVEATAREQLELNPDSPVIVLTDKPLHISNDRLLRMGPQSGVNDVAIARIAARISPAGQVMIRVRNRSSLSRVMLRAFCDGRETARQEVSLPAMGQEQDYFLPIDATAKVIRAQIDASDDFAGDNAAFLARRGSWPVIEPHTPVFAELARLMEKYSRLRPAGAESKRIAIVTADGAGKGPEIVLAKPGVAASGPMEVLDHPITQSLQRIDWPVLAKEGLAEPAGDAWKPLVRVGGKAAIAVRDTPARQVWVGIDTQQISNTPEFVILWSNIFDWVSEGGEEFVAQTTGDLESGWSATESLSAGLKPGWWPGIYRRSDGALLAVNAPDVAVSTPQRIDWKLKLAELARQHRQNNGIFDLTTPLIIAAMLLMLLAAITWRGGLRKLPASQTVRHGDERVTV